MIYIRISYADTTQSPPVVLEGSLSNITTVLGKAVTFQCRVKSRMFIPSIKWFRKLDDTSDFISKEKRSRAITYLDETYELLDGGGQMSLGNDIYMSKLILANVQLRDSGVYGCLALNYRGFNKKEAVLSVQYPNDWWDQSGKSTNFKSVFWLFLIPIAFCLLPLIMWIWLHTLKTHQKAPTENTKNVSNKTENSRNVFRNKAKNPYLVVNVEIV